MTAQDRRAAVAFAVELRKWWSFDDRQWHSHSWHDRENFIAVKLPELLSAALQKAREEELERCAAKLDSMSREYDTASGHAGKLIAAANAIRAARVKEG